MPIPNAIVATTTRGAPPLAKPPATRARAPASIPAWYASAPTPASESSAAIRSTSSRLQA